MFGLTSLAISAVMAAATMFAPLAVASPPSSGVCSAGVDTVWRPAWCGKKPPPKSYEKFRQALIDFRIASAGLVSEIVIANSSYQPIAGQCHNTPPVDEDAVSVIIGRMRLLGTQDKQRAEKALNRMSALAKTVFADSPDATGAKENLVVLARALALLGVDMDLLETAGIQYMASACGPAEDARGQAAYDVAYYEQRIASVLVSLSSMLGATQERCKSVLVQDPYTDKSMRKAAGAKATKTTSVGDMSMQYPTSLNVGGKGLWLPINLDSKSPSGYVQVELTQGAKDLAAVGGGTPAGESGLQIKVFGKAKPGKATLRLTFQPAGGAQVTKAVTLKFG